MGDRTHVSEFDCIKNYVAIDFVIFFMM